MVHSIRPADRARNDDVRHGDDIDYIEYGIQLPNGHLLWSGFDLFNTFRGVDWLHLNLQVNQDRAQEGYAKHLERQGISYDPQTHRLQFIQRVQQIRFTEPTTLEGVDLPEFGDDF